MQAVKHLPHFPSASAIEYSNQRLYLFGDDAPYLLILDTAFKELDTVRFHPDTAYRIRKEAKPDIESATLMLYEGLPVITAFGSLSAANRDTAFLFPLVHPRHFKKRSLHELQAAIMPNATDLNIEGAAFVNNRLVLANRAHQANPINLLYIFNTDARPFSAHRIAIRLQQQNVIGISDLYYLPAKDRLLFTATEEETSSTTEDGRIGESYLGWINAFSTKLHQQTLTPNGLVSLPSADRRFSGQKIEAICAIQQTKDEVILVLAADNDDGRSTLFKVVMQD